MNRRVKIMGIVLVLIIGVSIYQAKGLAASETKNYVTKKETAEMVGRAILMELFPNTVRLGTALNVVDREDTWYIHNELGSSIWKDNNGNFGITFGGVVGVVIKKENCQIVEIVVLD